MDRDGDLERAAGVQGGGTGDLESATTGVYEGGVLTSGGTGGSLGAAIGTGGSPGAETVAGASKLVGTLPPVSWFNVM